MNTSVLIVLIVVGGLAFALLIVGLVVMIFKLAQVLGGTKGGWRKLAQAYPGDTPPSGHLWERETVKIGAVVYKRCATVGVTRSGLFIKAWGRAALIPWDAFTDVGHATLYWQQMPMLTVGTPAIATIVISPEIFRHVRSHLPDRLRDRA